MHQFAERNKSTAGLLVCSHQADIRMRSHRFIRLDDNKSGLMQVVLTACCKSTNMNLHKKIAMKSTGLMQQDSLRNISNFRKVALKFTIVLDYTRA